MAQEEIVPGEGAVTVEVPGPVPARQHVAIVPFVPSLTVKSSLVQRVRGWWS